MDRRVIGILTSIGLLLAMVLNGQVNKSLSMKDDIRIVPMPYSLENKDGEFIIDSETVIYSKPENAFITHLFTQSLSSALGYKIKVTDEPRKNNIISLQINDQALYSSPEAYTLCIKQNRIDIDAPSDKGLFYGLQTLRQLFTPDSYMPEKIQGKKWTIPCMEINDKPRFTWRGVLLDPARHFIDIEDIKTYIDAMAMYKLNILHLHLTDVQGWRLEIKKYPKLAEIGGIGDRSSRSGPARYYTQEEIKELIKYASDRYILIMPEIEMPGHSGTIARTYPEYYFGHNAIQLGNDKTYDFFKDILKEVIELFPSLYIHYGGDEVNRNDWEKDEQKMRKMKELNLNTPHQLEQYFSRYMADYIISEGKIPVAWDAVAPAGVDKKSILMRWRYQDSIDILAAKKNGNDLLLTLNDYAYLSAPNENGEYGPKVSLKPPTTLKKIYNWEPISEIVADASDRIFGVQACFWGEIIIDNKVLQYLSFPRLLAFAEVAWTLPENKTFNEFCKSVNNEMKKFELLGINYRREIDFVKLSNWGINSKTQEHLVPAGILESKSNYVVRFEGGKDIDLESLTLVSSDGKIISKGKIIEFDWKGKVMRTNSKDLDVAIYIDSDLGDKPCKLVFKYNAPSKHSSGSLCIAKVQEEGFRIGPIYGIESKH